MFLPMNYPNWVKRAADLIGGPTKTAHAVGVSNSAVHAWMKKGRVPNIDKAKILAKLSGIELLKLRRVG